MRMLRAWLLRLAGIFHKNERERELADEIESHLQFHIDDNLRNGMTIEEARRQALLKLGGVEQTKEIYRERRSLPMIETLLQDLRYSVRMLCKNPGFTAVAVLTLALGIGANIAIFTLVDAVMLKSLPVPHPNELYQAGDSGSCCVVTGLQDSFSIYSYALYRHLRDNTPDFSELAVFPAQSRLLSVRRAGVSEAPQPGVGEYVSGNYFQMFGVGSFAGRPLAPSDDGPSAAPAGVMSYRAWHERYGADPSVVGSTFTIDGLPVTIVGIAPAGFFGDTLQSDPPDFWIPLSLEPLLAQQNSLLNHDDVHWLYIIGRLRSGVQPRQAQAHITVELQNWLSHQANLSELEPKKIASQHIVLKPAAGGLTYMREVYGDGLRLLLVISGLVLMIACANIANLLLARSAANRLPMAVRLALGATHTRLVRLALTESILLALLGGIAGLAVAAAGTQVILLLVFRGARYVPIGAAPSPLALAYAFGLSLLTGVIFGVVPAWLNSRANPAEALHGAGRSTRDRSTLPRKSLVVLQAALSVVLLVGAGLLTMSLRHLEHQPFGFETEGRFVVKINPELAGYTPERLGGLYQQLQQQLTQIPGVRSASFSLYGPMAGHNWSGPISIEGRPTDPRHSDYSSWDRVGAHYFETIGTHLIQGRLITEQDTPSSRHVAVINQTLARQYYPKDDPIGKHLGPGDASHSNDFEIVGIVDDAKYLRARSPAFPTIFLPLLQNVPYKETEEISAQNRSNYIHEIELLVDGHPQNLQDAVRKTLAGIDPNLTVLDMMTLEEQVSRNFNQERLISRLTALYGLLALALACVGLYGVVGYSVARRTNEIGVRMALGAQPRDVFRLIIGEGVTVALAGIGIGVVAAFALTRWMASFLFGVTPSDPLTFAAAALVLTTVALIACYVPARRATRVDPMVALRHE